MNHISFTVPLEQNALRRTITMLQGMESDLHSTPTLPEFEPRQHLTLTEADSIADLTGQPRPDNVSTVTSQESEYALDPVTAFGLGFDVDSVKRIEGSDVVEPEAPSEENDVGLGLDAEGMLWDGRIHTSAKTKVANGTWKLTRGVDKDLVEAIKAQHLGNVSALMPSNEPTVTRPIVPTIDQATPPPPPPTPLADGVNPARVFIGELGRAGKAPSEVIAACQKHGVATLQMLLSMPEKVPAIRAELGL